MINVIVNTAQKEFKELSDTVIYNKPLIVLSISLCEQVFSVLLFYSNKKLIFIHTHELIERKIPSCKRCISNKILVSIKI